MNMLELHSKMLGNKTAEVFNDELNKLGGLKSIFRAAKEVPYKIKDLADDFIYSTKSLGRNLDFAAGIYKKDPTYMNASAFQKGVINTAGGAGNFIGKYPKTAIGLATAATIGIPTAVVKNELAYYDKNKA